MNYASDDKDLNIKEKHIVKNPKRYKQSHMRSTFRARKILLSAVSAITVLAISASVAAFTISNVNAQSSEKIRAELAEEISYVDTRIADAQNLTAAAIAGKAMEESVNAPVLAYALKIDGKTAAILASDDEIRNVLSSMKKCAVEDHVEAKAQFVEKIEIFEGMYNANDIIDSDRLSELLNKSSKVMLIHTVDKGDTRDSISKYYGITVQELIKLNPNIKNKKLKNGDKLKIVIEKKPISIKFTVTETKTQTIKFNKETVEDNILSTSYKKVTTEGKNGEKEVTAKITYVDGREAIKDVIDENIITEAVNEITTVGTNDNPGASLGRFCWPLPEYSIITSKFGPRWGTNHNGIDISGSGVYGADIVAADGGEVILAQEDNSGYGKHIIIDHGNGYQTQYAHCSELFVSAGDKVNCGQRIAAVGSTGNSTGPHLHFEIIKNNEKTDPLIYLDS